MLTNMTRKGLSLAATIALAAASLVGLSAPAQAAIGSNLVVADKGTSTTFVGGEAFTLRLNGSYLADTQLRWLITVPTGEFASYDVKTSTASGVAAPVAVSTTSTTILATPLVQTGPGANKLVITQTSTTSASVIQVRAFVETNGVDGYQAGQDIAAPEVTVTFVKEADLVPTITITQPFEGDTRVNAKLSFNINNEQLNHNSVSATVAYADGSTTFVTGSPTVATWSSTAHFVISASGTAIAKNKAIAVRAKFDGTDLGAAATTIAVQNRTVGSFTTSGVVSANLATSASGSVKTRLNSTFAVKIAAKDLANFDATTASAVAGAKVTVGIVSSATMSGTATTLQTLTVNGVAYSDTTKLPGKTGVDKIALTTNAAGEIELTMSTANFIAGNTITLTVEAENLGSHDFVITQETPSFTGFLTELNDGTHAVVKGSTVIRATVRDQFGGVPADGAFQVKALYSESARTTAATAASGAVASVVGGVATATIVDNGAGAGTSTYNVRLYELKPLASDVETVIKNGFVITYTAAALTAGTVTITGSDLAQNATTKVYSVSVSAVLMLKNLFAHDTRTAQIDGPDDTGGYTFSGTVSSAATPTAASAAIGGVPVTVAGPADMLVSFTGYGNDKVYGLGSVTGYTDAAGGYSFKVFSNTSGKKTVTVTSGAGTATLEVTFAAAAAGTGTSLVITSPATVVPGSTFQASIKLTDKYGNPVSSSIKVEVTGPGFRVGDLPTKTDKDGLATVAYFLGANDTGEMKVTASYDRNADGDYADATDLVVVKSTTIGGAAAVPASDQKLTVGSFKGFVAIYALNYTGQKLSAKVAGRWLVENNLSRFQRVVRNTGAAIPIKVDLYIDGKFVRTENIVTK